MTEEKVDLGRSFYIYTNGKEYKLGVDLKEKLVEININEAAYKSLKRREGGKSASILDYIMNVDIKNVDKFEESPDDRDDIVGEDM